MVEIGTAWRRGLTFTGTALNSLIYHWVFYDPPDHSDQDKRILAFRNSRVKGYSHKAKKNRKLHQPASSDQNRLGSVAFSPDHRPP